MGSNPARTCFFVFSGFGQSIEFHEILLIFLLFFDFFMLFTKKFRKLFRLQNQGVFCAFEAVVTLMFEMP